MTCAQALLAAARVLVGFLAMSTDPTTTTINAVFTVPLSPAAELRHQADDIEARDRAIAQFRAALAACDAEAAAMVQVGGGVVLTPMPTEKGDR